MSTAGPPTFNAFFKAVHGYPPFPWQSRLAARVVDEGRWPSLLDLPTGTGKTSAIDVALYALACRPEVFPRRVVLVVDRRVVVDQGADHARSIQGAMIAAREGAAREVASALRDLFGGSGEDLPFIVSVLRGGMPRDESWADRPDRAVVALSTVDQVGSRLLFRGYGVSPRMAPIHAGLLGNDTLFLLDEVQLSTAFAETLHVLERRWRPWHSRVGGSKLPDRWAVVRMSATPIDNPDEAPSFELDDDDRAHPVLARRLEARKIASLKQVKVSKEELDRVERFAHECAIAAREHLQRGARTVAVVVNRVDTARRVHRILHDPGEREFDVVLLTGRMRPLDRAEMMGRHDDPASLAGRVIAGRIRSEMTRPIIVVATQCIEAGADFDFDALVTECASLDALRQRFGRVDRRGELGESQATILARHDHLDSKADDPIYGKALSATWAWLTAAGGESVKIDFGMAGFPHLPTDPSQLQSLCSPVVHSPVLLPAHIDAWSQTNPRPEPDPEVALWLHGPGRDVAEVRLIWRADVDEVVLNERETGPYRALLPQLAVAPPSSLESISVPIAAARSWLMVREIETFGDVEGARDDDDAGPRPGTSGGRRCIRVRRDSAEIIEASDVRPNDTLIVPSTYGGIAHGTWDPSASDFVPDLGDWAQLVHRGRAVLRLVPNVLAGTDVSGAKASADPSSSEPGAFAAARNAPLNRKSDSQDFDAATAIKSWVELARVEAEGRLQIVLHAMSPGRSAILPFRVVEIAANRFAIVGRRPVDPLRLGDLVENVASEVLTEDDDSSSFIGVELGLRRHLSDVRAQTESFARNLGLTEHTVSDVALAAWMHDIGKADRRFQQILVGGNELRLAMQREPLAKSAGELRDAAARTRARERAGYPPGYRHELLSVAMLEQTEGALTAAHDRELVLHLVGSHHGWCRPFAPATDPGPSLSVDFELDGIELRAETDHRLARLDSGVADRFFNLVERYGWWGLAWLEAIMRLADHRASEAAGKTVDDEHTNEPQASGSIQESALRIKTQ